MRHSVLAIACLCLLLSAPAHAYLDSDLAASTEGGGCFPTGIQPGVLDMLTLVNPEWAPVTNGTVVDTAPTLIHGTVLDMHGDLSGDFPATHVRADVNVFMELDPSDEGTIATGNDDLEGHLEWEAGAWPAWAWPGVGDRVVALGRLIFDCGHPGGSAGLCSTSTLRQCVLDSDCRPPVCATCGSTETCIGTHYAYGSELHPPEATAVIRSGRGGLVSKHKNATPVPVTQVDIYVSSDGGGAGDRCILTHSASATDLLTTQCYPLSEPTAAINDQDFTFDMPVPPRPEHGRGFKLRKIIYDAPGGGHSAHVRVRRHLHDPEPHLEVTVRMTRPKKGPRQPTGFAGTILAGWRVDPTPLTHVRVTLQSAAINNALQLATPIAPRTCSDTTTTPCTTAADCPAGEQCWGLGPVKAWHIEAATNGQWQELSDLDSVDTLDDIPQTIVYDQYLPADGEVHLQADGVARECVDSLYNTSLATSLMNFGFTKGLTCLNSTAHNAGEIDVTYPGPDFGAGGGGTMDYETVSVGGQGGHCSTTTSQLCTVTADCPASESCVTTGGAFSLHYRIERLPS
jgi:hypothetical protein